MKKSNLFTFILIFIVTISKSQWYWLNPLPHGLHCYEIYTFSEDSLIVLTENGGLFSSSDGGLNFKQKEFNVNRDLYSLKRVSDSSFYLMSSAHGWHVTNDYFNTWTDISDKLPQGLNNNIPFFYNDSIGFFKLQNYLYKTTDNGNNWQPIFNSTDFGVNYYDSYSYVNDSIIYIVFMKMVNNYPRNYLVKTIDSGNSWNIIDSTGNNQIIRIYFFENGFGFKLSQNGFQKSLNGGDTWTNIQIPFNNLNKISVIDSLNFLTSTYSNGVSDINITNDGGLTYNTIQLNGSIFSISLTAAQSGYFSIGSLLYKFENNTVIPLSINSDNSFVEMCFVNSIDGFACGSNGIVYKTNNMGFNWQQINTNINSNFNSISFPSENIGYVIGSNNILLKTYNSGLTWVQKQPISLTDTLVHMIYFVNEHTGFAYSYNILYKTIDGGDNWFPILTNNTWFNNIFFLNDTIGFISDNSDWIEDGKLHKTTDGGNTWSHTNIFSDVWDIYFFDTMNGFVVSTSNLSNISWLFKTTDGGQNWTEIASFQGLICDIFFLDNLNGYLSMANNSFINDNVPSLYKTDNGGNSWTPEEFHFPLTYSYYKRLCKVNNNAALLYYGRNLTVNITNSTPCLNIIYSNSNSVNNACYTPYGTEVNFVGEAYQYSYGDTVQVKVDWDDSSYSIINNEVNNFGYFSGVLSHVYYSSGIFHPIIIATTPSETDTFHLSPLILHDGCGTVKGTVLINNDPVCTHDSLSQPLANIKVFIVDENGDIVNMQYTDNSGNFAIDLPLSGNFTIQIDSSYLSQLYYICQNSFVVDLDNPSFYCFILYCNFNGFYNGSLVGTGIRPLEENPFFLNFIKYTCDSAEYEIELNYPTEIYVVNSGFSYTELPGSLNFGTFHLGNSGSLILPVSFTTDSLYSINDSICFNMMVYEDGVIVYNNEHCFPIINSYDPNSKEISPKNIFIETDTLIFTIHFQNTGNDFAYNVNIIDTIDSNVSYSSLNVIEASHDYNLRVISYNPLILEFFFPDIMLPDSSQSYLMSCGYVRYSILSLNSLPNTTCISNTSYIYFDYNPPIRTNTTINCLDDLSLSNFIALNKSFTLYPNPAEDKVFIELSKGANSIRIYNNFGQCVYANNVLNNESGNINLLDVSRIGKGIFFMQVFNYNEKENFNYKFIVK